MGRTCFNPHPAFRPGDATARRSRKHCAEVSIRTRPFGRVMLLLTDQIGVVFGVSIRTRPFGRVMLDVLADSIYPVSVSIRTRPFGRVMRPERHEDQAVE